MDCGNWMDCADWIRLEYNSGTDKNNRLKFHSSPVTSPLVTRTLYVTVLLRWLIFATLIVATMLGSSRDTDWQMGTFRVEVADIDGWKGNGVSAARRLPGRESTNPLSNTVIFDISSASGSYRAAISALLVDESVSYEELFPWLMNLPPRVQFRIKGKTLYLLDSKNKQHKADIIASGKPDSLPDRKAFH